jgi:hypothetical protein
MPLTWRIASEAGQTYFPQFASLFCSDYFYFVTVRLGGIIAEDTTTSGRRTANSVQ